MKRKLLNSIRVDVSIVSFSSGREWRIVLRRCVCSCNFVKFDFRQSCEVVKSSVFVSCVIFQVSPSDDVSIVSFSSSRE